MSRERAWIIGLPADGPHQAVMADIQSAIGRSRKAEPGDRLDIARFEALATRLEQAALNDRQAPRVEVAVPGPLAEALLFGPDSSAWSDNLPADIRSAAQACADRGWLPVLVIDPFGVGATAAGAEGEAEGPARRWKPDGERGRRAVEARFRAQIAEALSADSRHRVAISPSGIQNPVVTEILREFVAGAPGTRRVDAPVEYRDGSRSAHPFPLRSLPLRDLLPVASLQLRFALLSIRHTEMDAVVAGAWLRNAEVSRPRPAAQTDDLVYETSLEQLKELCRGQRHVRLYMYQTGLETAVVGFYRAVTDHLLRHPGSPAFIPGASTERFDVPATVTINTQQYRRRGRGQDHQVR
jgi:hypothetical protein